MLYDPLLLRYRRLHEIFISRNTGAAVKTHIFFFCFILLLGGIIYIVLENGFDLMWTQDKADLGPFEMNNINILELK